MEAIIITQNKGKFLFTRCFVLLWRLRFNHERMKSGVELFFESIVD